MRLRDKWFNDRDFLLPYFEALIGNEKNWKMPFQTTVPSYDIVCQLDSGKKRLMNVFRFYSEAAIFFTGARLEVINEDAGNYGIEGSIKLVKCEGYYNAIGA